jgi:hypothetical protein
MKKKFQLGKLYKIRFYDHSIGTSEKMICEAVGWVITDDSHQLVLSHWIVDTKDEQVKKENIEPISIIKSCIIRSRKLG